MAVRPTRVERPVVLREAETPNDALAPETALTTSERSRARRARPVLLLAAPAAVILLGGYLYFTGGRWVTTENAYVKADKVMIGPEIGGRITAVAVAENERVAKGAELFRIDDAPHRIALSRADAQRASVRTEIESLRASLRQKQEELKLARTSSGFAEREHDRQSRLVERNIVSQSKHDSSRNDADLARQKMVVIQQEIAQINARLAGAPDEPVERHPLYRAADAAYEQAALDLRRTVVRAPFSGMVSRKPELGQMVAASTPVLGLVGDQRIWVEANFKETELTHIRPGQVAIIRIDTYPDNVWHGTVDSLSQATGAEFSILPPQNATGNWIKVVQRIPVRITVEPVAGDPALRAGMSAVVEIDTGRRRAAPGFVHAILGWAEAAIDPRP